MKKIIYNILLILIFININSIVVYCQVLQQVKFVNSIVKDTIIPCPAIKQSAFSCQMDGNYILLSEKSLIRVILNDVNGDSYLIHEISPIYEDTLVGSFKNVGIETQCLTGIIPKEIIIEVYDAELQLVEINFRKQNINDKEKGIDYKNKFEQKRIANINKYIKKHNLNWVAGETQISKLSFNEFKNKFSTKKLPNSYGQEYYINGAFEISGINRIIEGNSVYPIFFSYNNFHGTDWITKGKEQIFDGNCGAFAECSVLEALINLYYNQHLNIDLSEQNVISCYYQAGFSTCTGSSQWPQLCRTISGGGITNEQCYPLNPNSLAYMYGVKNGIPCTLNDYRNGTGCVLCAARCANYENEKWNTLGYLQISNSGTVFDYGERVKNYLINNGPLEVSLNNIGHMVTLIGWEYINNKLYLISKDNHIDYLRKDLFELNLNYDPITAFTFAAYQTTIIPPNNYHPMVKLTDSDCDGYYYWGIGSRPINCPKSIPLLADGNDSNSSLGPNDINYNQMTINELLLQSISVELNETLTWSSKLLVNVAPNNSAFLIKGNSSSGGNVKIVSATEIILNAGFEMQPGSSFEAIIDNPCNYK